MSENTPELPARDDIPADIEEVTGEDVESDFDEDSEDI